MYNGLLMIFATDTLLELVDVTDAPDWGIKCTRVTMKVFPRAVGAMYTTLWSREDLKGLRDSVSLIDLHLDPEHCSLIAPGLP